LGSVLVRDCVCTLDKSDNRQGDGYYQCNSRAGQRDPLTLCCRLPTSQDILTLERRWLRLLTRAACR
jgi:hypothetical protein